MGKSNSIFDSPISVKHSLNKYGSSKAVSCEECSSKGKVDSEINKRNKKVRKLLSKQGYIPAVFSGWSSNSR